MKTIIRKKRNFVDRKDLVNKIGLGLSITILALVVLALVAVYCDTHTYGNTLIPGDKGPTPYYPAPVFSTLDASLLGYFSFAINILVGCACIANIVEFALVRKGKLQKVHDFLHVLNFTQATCLAFNFIYTIVYLIPICCVTRVYSFEYLFTGSNLIFNVATPILGVLLYIFCFKGYSLKNKWWALLGAIPTTVYFVVYTVLALVYSNGSVTDPTWDVYRFGSLSKYFVILALVLIIFIACHMCIGLWKLNQIGKWNRYMIIAVVNIFLAASVVVFAMALMWRTNLINDRFIENLGAAQTFFMRFMYFTHLSNWWVGATCIIYAVYAIRIYKGKINNIPIWAQIARLAGIAAISITLIMQLVVSTAWMFEPLKDASITWQRALTEGYIKCFRKHLLFEHFIIPFMSIASFIVLEHTDLKWKHILHSSAPMAIYVACYAIVLYSTLSLTPAYEIDSRWVCPWDIYNIRGMLGAGGKYIYWVLPFIVYPLMLIINWLFWYFNRKIHFDKPKKGNCITELKLDWAQFKRWKANKKCAR